jgi:hypothetical protein
MSTSAVLSPRGSTAEVSSNGHDLLTRFGGGTHAAVVLRSIRKELVGELVAHALVSRMADSKITSLS